MSNLLITVIVIATFAILLGAGVNYIDRAGMADAASARTLQADYSRLTTAIISYQTAHGRLPPTIGWQTAIEPYAGASVQRGRLRARWVYVARENGYGLCLDHTTIGPRGRHLLAPLACAALPEVIAGGLVLARPAQTRLFDETARAPGVMADLVQRDFALVNIANQSLRITKMAFAPTTAFRLETGRNTCLGATLASDDTCTFSVIFAADANGRFSDDLQIEATPTSNTADTGAGENSPPAPLDDNTRTGKAG